VLYTYNAIGDLAPVSERGGRCDFLQIRGGGGNLISITILVRLPHCKRLSIQMARA